MQGQDPLGFFPKAVVAALVVFGLLALVASALL